MIYAKRNDLHRYKGLCPALDTAIEYLLHADLTQLKPGRNEVDGDNVFVNRFDYVSVPESEAIWEGHARYGDIQIMIEGKEQIGVSHSDTLETTVRKEADDFIGYAGPVSNWFPMEDQDVLIVFPEDVHMVKVLLGESMHVSRAVIKFKL